MPANSVIQLRRGTAAAWTSANPVLALAEPGYETDTGKEKRGDGSTPWNSLPYFAVASMSFPVPAPSGGDDTAVVRAVIDAAPEGAELVFKAGATYLIGSLGPITKSLRLNGNGAHITTDITDGTGAGSPLFHFTGAVAAQHNMTAAAGGDFTVFTSIFSEGANYSAGDYVLIEDSTVVARWDGGVTGATGRGEMNRVVTATGATLTLAKPIEWDYTATPKIRRVSKMLEAPSVHGFHVEEVDPGLTWPGGLLYGPWAPNLMAFEYCDTPRVESCFFKGWQLHTANFRYCTNPLYRGNDGRDPFRPPDGGHGYMMRFTRCNGGVASEGSARAVRHHVDFDMTYDGTSRDNLSLDGRNVQFYCHGTGSKRCASYGDRVSGGTGPGWQGGNETYAADFDYTIVAPRYRGKQQAIVIEATTDGARIIDPDIHMFNRGQAITISSGAKRVDLSGGVIQSPATNIGDAIIDVRTELIPGDASTVTVGDVRIRNVRFKGSTTLEIDSAGVVELEHNNWDSLNVTASGQAVVKIKTRSPSRLVERGNRYAGTYGIDLLVDPALTAPARGWELEDQWQQAQRLAVGEPTMPRTLALNTVTQTSGTLRLAFFTAQRSEVISQLRVVAIGAAAATPTLIRTGLFTVDSSGNLTLVASTANDTTLLAAAGTGYTKALSASFTKKAGQRYAVGTLVVTSATAPTLLGQSFAAGNAAEAGMAPRIGGAVTGQTDLPSSVTAAALSGNGVAAPYVVLLP